MPDSKGKDAQRQNVRVVCRVRPQNSQEKVKGSDCVKLTDTSIQVNAPDVSSGPMFFDRVFGPSSTQKEVYEDAAVPLITDVLAGYNATIFAYGQSGSGKTHTMEGSKSDPSLAGIIPRAANGIFDGVMSADENIEFMLSASFVEIYMEKIRDLLDDVGVNINLQVREDPGKGIYIEGVTEEYVTSVEELLGLMTKGSRNRATAATGLNEGSSRSHSLFSIVVQQRDLSNNSTTTGKLYLVDLAGSETMKKTGASGQQMEEAKTINKSLSALGQVINALTDPKATHVPYRDSKLTRVLQDSLGGNSKTVLIIACSPSTFNATETLSTLRFGTRAKSITNKIVVNKTRSLEELEALLARSEKAIDAMASHITDLTTQLQVAQMQGGTSGGGRGGVGSSEAAALMATLQAKIAQLESDIEEEKEESGRKDEEVVTLKEMLLAKEKILLESDQLMQEAQAHIEEKRLQMDKVSREKTELATRLEEIQSKMELEYSKSNFSVKELQVTVDTLKKENKALMQELREYAGEKKSMMGDDNSTVVSSTDKDSKFNMEGVDLSYGSMSKNLGTLQEKLLETRTDDGGNQSSNYAPQEVAQFMTSFQRSAEEMEKRYKEMQIQRDLLEKDLSLVSKKAEKYENELQAVQNMSEVNAAKFFDDKSKTQLKSLQHRLEQLVAVHRQLLRKFTSLDIENGDLKKKITLRDERIESLESNSRNATSALRQQTEAHIAELTSLREQLQSFRTEGGPMRRESAIGVPHAGTRQVMRGGNNNINNNNSEKVAAPSKTLRGGGEMTPSGSMSPTKKKSFFKMMVGGK